MYVNARPKTHDYDNNFVAHKCVTCKTFLNRGFSHEQLRITANNRDNLRKAKTSCEFPIRTLSYLKSRKWDSTFSVKVERVAKSEN